jgi:glucokinase
MLGVELRDGAIVAVAVDEAGRVRARAEARAADLAAGALEALDRVAVSDAPGAGVGIAAVAPDSSAAADAVRAVVQRYGGALVNDAAVASGTAAAVAEAWTGAARQAREVVLFSVAEHTTAGIVRDGSPVVGAHGRAPAVAWLALNPVEREDYRKTGCLEAEVAASGIVRRLIWRIKAGDRSRVQDMVGDDLSAITIDHLLDAARQKDGVSFSVVRDTAKYLGMAAANLVAIADPDILVVGGIMASAADLFLEPLRVEVGRRLPSPMVQALTIEPAALGPDAAAIGAARLAAAAWR